MSIGERLDMLAARVAEDTKSISHLLDQSTGLTPNINSLRSLIHERDADPSNQALLLMGHGKLCWMPLGSSEGLQ